METIQNNQISEKRHSEFVATWKRFRRNKGAVVGLVVIILILFLIFGADLIVDYQKDVIQQNSAIMKQPPSAEHIFGTDQFGRDIFARVLFGGRISLAISLSITLLSFIIGSLIGAISGFFGGIVDTIIMRTVDMLLAIPPILLAITVVAALGANEVNLVIALTVASIPGGARFLRSIVLSLRNQEFVEAARAVGTKDLRILLKHIVPNAMGPMIVNSTLGIARTILGTAGLSFIGLGIQPPTPEWGNMLSSAREFIMTSPYMIIFPGLAIFITAMSINLFGDGLRDALDPRLR